MRNNIPSVVHGTHSPVEYGTPNTVSTIVEIKQYLVEFCDGDGKKHRDVVMRLGDTGPFVATPNGEDWCRTLGHLNKWLETAMIARIDKKASAPVTVPSSDPVDVLEAPVKK
jgi:hypothetical protein